MRRAEVVAVQVLVAKAGGSDLVTVPSRHVGPGPAPTGHTRHVGPPLSARRSSGRTDGKVRHVGPGEPPADLDAVRHVGPGAHPTKGKPAAGATRTPESGKPESSREARLRGLEKARAAKKAKREATEKEAAASAAAGTPPPSGTRKKAPKAGEKTTKRTAKKVAKGAAEKSTSAPKSAPKKTAKKRAAPKSTSAPKSAPKKTAKKRTAPKGATPASASPRSVAPRAAPAPEAAGPATQRAPGSQPASPLSDRQFFTRLEQYLKEQGAEASFPTFKRIWESGGKAATLAWMKEHKHTDLIVAFHDWATKNLEQAKAMIGAAPSGGHAA